MYIAEDGSRWATKYDSLGNVPSLSEREAERRKEQRYTDALRRQQLESNRITMDNAKYEGWRESMNDHAQAFGRGRPITGKPGKTRYAPTATATPAQSNMRYQVDYKAAQDAGAFLKSIKDGKLEDATRILNGNPYSSINNAAGVSIDQDETGNQFVSIMGKDGQPLKRVSLAKLEEQLSNMNNYTVRMKGTAIPARDSILDSKELAEGAAKYSMDAYNAAVSGAEFRDGRWSRAGQNGGLETFDPEAIKQQAYDTFIQKYGPREASMKYETDPGYFSGQTPASYGEWYEGTPGGLGFATQYRYNKPGRTGYSDSIDSLVNALTGNGGNQAGGATEPPPPKTTDNKPASNPGYNPTAYNPGTANPYAQISQVQNANLYPVKDSSLAAR